MLLWPAEKKLIYVLLRLAEKSAVNFLKPAIRPEILLKALRSFWSQDGL